jgi:UDP-arabinose 4-epimerase
MRTALVTGGAGYIGAASCQAFANAGWRAVAYDNLSSGIRESVKWGPLIEADIRDRVKLAAALEHSSPHLVVHLAACASVAESMGEPADYYHINGFGTLVLLEEMRRYGVDRLIFSSTCATYGIPFQTPLEELHPQSPINPYGWSKLMAERMIDDFNKAYGLSAVILRFFNAAGVDADGRSDRRRYQQARAIPQLIDALCGKGGCFTINGVDYDTPDRSAVRDYVHVSDLADAHVLAAERLMKKGGMHVYNLGTGQGTSVLELVGAMERVSGSSVPVRHGPRRVGDPPILVASRRKANAELGWAPRYSSIESIIGTELTSVSSRRDMREALVVSAQNVLARS